MLTRRPTSAAVASVAMLALAGCGDDDRSTSDDESPLAEYLGEDAVSFEAGGMNVSFGSGGSEPHEPTEEELQQQREVEEFVATCMAAQGFEYVPNEVSPGDFASPFDEAYSLPPDEFAEQYGYGASTLRFDELEMPEDPNQEIRESLAPEALEEYERALYGDTPGVEAEGGVPTAPPVEDRGCYGQASAEVFGNDEDESSAGPPSEFEGLMEDLFRLGERLREEPRVIEANERWHECMADVGYPEFERVGDPEQAVFQRMAELEGFGGAAADPAPAARSEEGDVGERATPQPVEPKEIDPAELEKLQQYELALAQADFGCREKHYNDIVEEVQYELEEEFVAEHRAELERFRDEIARLGAKADAGASGD